MISNVFLMFLERPVRSFELLADIQASWNKDKLLNAFVISLTPLAMPLSHLKDIPSPIAAALACTPNFQGNRLTIYRSTIFGLLEWRRVTDHIRLFQTPSAVAFAQGEFLVLCTGPPDKSFLIEFVSFPSPTSR